MDLPHGDTVGFKGVTSGLGAEALAELSVLKKLLRKKRYLRSFPVLSEVREGFFGHIQLCEKHTHLRMVCVCLAWSSLLSRHCCSVDCLCCDLEIRYFSLKRSTENQLNLKYGCTVSLVAEHRFSQFRDLFWWPRRVFLYSSWDEEAAPLEAFEQRVKLFVSFDEEGREVLVRSSTSLHVSNRTLFGMFETT